jgi:hypothetical protein
VGHLHSWIEFIFSIIPKQHNTIGFVILVSLYPDDGIVFGATGSLSFLG